MANNIRWHADLKPYNIVRVHGEFKLADFGFAKYTRKQTDKLPSEHMRGGTDSYGTITVSPRAQVWLHDFKLTDCLA